MDEYDKDVSLAVNKLRLMTPGDEINLFGSTVVRSHICGTFQINGMDGLHPIRSTARKIIDAHRRQEIAVTC